MKLNQGETGQNRLEFFRKSRAGLALEALALTTIACKSSELISKWTEMPLEYKVPLGIFAVAFILGGTWLAGKVANSIGDTIMGTTTAPKKPLPRNGDEIFSKWF